MGEGSSLEKVELHVTVGKDILDKFRQLVNSKYQGYARGQLSIEVEKHSSLGLLH
jgi:hypothetical protein